MGGKKLLVGGIVIVALIVIAYFAFMYPPPSKEDSSGAIGVAKKYRSEQITDNDVVLKEQEAAAAKAVAAMTPDEKAAFFEKATPVQRFDMLCRSGNVVNNLVGRVDPALAAKAFTVATPDQRVEMYNSLPAERQTAVLKSINMTAEAFNKLPVAEKSNAFMGKSAAPLLGMIVANASWEARTPVMARFTPDMQRTWIDQLGRDQKIELVGSAAAPVIADMQRQDAAVAEFERYTADQQWQRVSASERVVGNLCGRVDPGLAAQVFTVATPEERVNMYTSLPAERQTAVISRIGMTAQRFNALPVAEKSNALMGKSAAPLLGMIVANTSMEARTPVFARFTPDMQRTWIGQLGRQDKAEAMGYRPALSLADQQLRDAAVAQFERSAPNEQWQRVSASGRVVGDLCNRVDPTLAAKVFTVATPDQRIEMYNSLPVERQTAVLKSMNMTAERFNALPVAEKSSLITGKSAPLLGMIVANASWEARNPVLARFTPDMQRTWMDQLGRDDKAALMGFKPASVQAERSSMDMERSAPAVK